MPKLAQVLLETGSNPNAQTHVTSMKGLDETEEETVYKQTPLHVAITNKHEQVVKVFLEYKGKSRK